MNVYEVKHFTILDIGSGLSTKSPLEVEAYTVAVSLMPRIFLGQQPFGFLRRNGVLWVPQRQYQQTMGFIRTAVREERGYPGRLLSEFGQRTVNLRCSLDGFSGGGADLLKLWTAYCELLGYVAFNWILPACDLVALLLETTAMSEEEAREWLTAVSVPIQPPHFLLFEDARLRAAAQLLQGSEYVNDFIREWGVLADAGIVEDSGRYLDPRYVRDNLEALARQHRDLEGIEQARQQLRELHRAARRRCESAVGFALAVTPRGHHPLIRDLAALQQVAAEAEEQRHVWQLRAKARLELWARRKGLTPQQLSCAAIGLPHGVPPVQESSWLKAYA